MFLVYRVTLGLKPLVVCTRDKLGRVSAYPVCSWEERFSDTLFATNLVQKQSLPGNGLCALNRWTLLSQSHKLLYSADRCPCTSQMFVYLIDVPVPHRCPYTSQIFLYLTDVPVPHRCSCTLQMLLYLTGVPVHTLACEITEPKKPKSHSTIVSLAQNDLPAADTRGDHNLHIAFNCCVKMFPSLSFVH